LINYLIFLEENKIFTFDDSNSGYITKQGVVYTKKTGWADCDIAKTPLTNYEKRAFFHFDCSTMPKHPIRKIKKVEFLREDDVVQPPLQPLNTDILIGSWIAPSLEAGAADFTGGNSMFLNILQSPAYGDDQWINLSDGGADPTAYCDPDGWTDIAIRDTSVTVNATGHAFNNVRLKCKLRLTSIYPEIAPGRGENGYAV